MLKSVTGQATQAAKHFTKVPIGARFADRTTVGGFDNNNLILRERRLAEGIFAIALFESTTLFHDHGGQGAHAKRGENECMFFSFSPMLIFQVA